MRSWNGTFAGIVASLALVGLACAQDTGDGPPSDAELAQQEQLTTTVMSLVRDLRGPNALATAQRLNTQAPAALGLTGASQSDLLTTAAAVFKANNLSQDVDTALKRRAELSLLETDGTAHARDLVWADLMEDYAGWLASEGRFAEAVAAQLDAVATYRAFLGATSPGMAPHLFLLADWADQAPAIPPSDRITYRDEAKLRQAQLDADLLVPLAGNAVPAIAPGDARVRRVRVFYATDRQATVNGVGNDRFFSSKPATVLSYGHIDLQVPQRPGPGRPLADGIFRIEVTPAQLKATAPLGSKPLTRAQLLAGVNGATEVLIYVHGFRNSFLDAARVAANLHVDLDVQGATLFYSWPAQYEVGGYDRDERVAEDANADRAGILRGLIAEVAAQNPGSRIYLVAHSMGNRIAVEALVKLVVAAGKPPPLKHVVLASPDMAAPALVKLTPDLKKRTSGVTLYSSRRDLALVASHVQHSCVIGGGSACPRAGIPEKLPANLAIDKLDTTKAPERLGGLASDWLGHDDFMRSGLTDMRAVVWQGMGVKGRCFLSSKSGYYVFSGGTCKLQAFSEAVALRRVNGSRVAAVAKASQRLASAAAADKPYWTEVVQLVGSWP